MAKDSELKSGLPKTGAAAQQNVSFDHEKRASNSPSEKRGDGKAANAPLVPYS